MLQGLATQSSQGSVERLLRKKRVRTKVPMKPKSVAAVVTAEDACAQRRPITPLQASVRGWANVPRAIRPRIERARASNLPKNPISKGLKTEAGAGDHRQAQSTSAQAQGPWASSSGNEESVGEEVPVWYMDMLGDGHKSLDEAPYVLTMSENEAPHPGHLTRNRIPILLRANHEGWKPHSLEVGVLQRKLNRQDTGRGFQRLSKKRQFGNRVRVINQPRRSN